MGAVVSVPARIRIRLWLAYVQWTPEWSARTSRLAAAHCLQLRPGMTRTMATHLILVLTVVCALVATVAAADTAGWSSVGTFAHTHAFAASVAESHNHDEAAFVNAQRAELNARMTRGQDETVAHELQAVVVLGQYDLEGLQWTRVQEQLESTFGQANVEPHRPGASLLFVSARDTHKLADVMLWDGVEAVVPWMEAHKLSPEFAHGKTRLCSRVFARGDGAGAMELSVTTTPTPLSGLYSISESLSAHLQVHQIMTTESESSKGVAAAVHHDLDRLPASVRTNHKAQLQRRRELRVEVQCNNAAEVAKSLVQHRSVLWVEPRPVMRTSNKWAAGITQASEVNNHMIWDEGLNGTGQVVGVSDTGLDTSHCMFYDSNASVPYDTTSDAHRKLTTYVTYVNAADYADGHGTHVCGSVMGDVWNEDGEYDDEVDYNGMAFGAKIAFFDIGDQAGNLYLPPNIDNNVFQPMFDAGAHVLSNSWGASYAGYDTSAFNTDQFQWDEPSSIILFAAGNDGEFGSGSVGTPATAKDILAVGAALNSVQSWVEIEGDDINTNKYNYENMAYFSSQGPTLDGRLKPEIVAPGYWTTSAGANAGVSGDLHCDLLEEAGTSMATPTAAGNAALVREYFTRGYYPTALENPDDAFTPSGALIKAMMIHSASAMEALLDADQKLEALGTPPDNIQGYGRVQLNNVLTFLYTNPWYSLFVVGSSTAAGGDLYAQFTAKGQSDSYTITTGEDITRSLKFTLAWTDYPLVVGLTNGSLVNMLRFQVDTDTTTWYVNDTQNPVHELNISDPEPNTNYTITVTATRILRGPQPYSLVVSGNLNNITYEVQPEAEDDFLDDDGSSDGLGTTTIIIIVMSVAILLILGAAASKFYTSRAASSRPASEQAQPQSAVAMGPYAGFEDDT